MNTKIVITVEDKFYNDIDENDIELLKQKLNECLDENCPCGWSITIRKSEHVRCKDCKFSFVESVDADGVEPFRACKLKRDSEATYGLWVVSDDDYCSWAEPKDE